MNSPERTSDITAPNRRGQGKRTLGLIGFGEFGQLAAKHLAPHFDVRVNDVSWNAARVAKAESLGVAVEQDVHKLARESDVLFLCPPIRQLPDVLTDIHAHVQPGTLVMDACSVKYKPAKWMKNRLPENVEIIATHPLFGPVGAAKGLVGHRIVLCPVRATPAHVAQLAQFWETLGLKVIHATPETHDREMAQRQSLAFALGRALHVALPKQRPSGRAAGALYELAAFITKHAPELQRDMLERNPYAKGARRDLIQALQAIRRAPPAHATTAIGLALARVLPERGDWSTATAERLYLLKEKAQAAKPLDHPRNASDTLEARALLPRVITALQRIDRKPKNRKPAPVKK